MGKKTEKQEPVPDKIIDYKPLREYPAEEQARIIFKNRYGRSDISCYHCKKTFLQLDQLIKGRYFERFINYSAICPDPICKGLLFHQNFNITQQEGQEPVYHPKIVPERDCPVDCPNKEESCHLINDCAYRRETLNLPSINCDKCSHNAWNLLKKPDGDYLQCRFCKDEISYVKDKPKPAKKPRKTKQPKPESRIVEIMQGTEPGIVTGSETIYPNWWRNGILARDRDIKQGEVIVQNCDNCRHYFKADHVRCSTCQDPARAFLHWENRKEVHKFPAPCPYCHKSNPGWRAIESRPYLEMDYPEPAKQFSQMCHECSLIHDVDLTPKQIRETKAKQAAVKHRIKSDKTILTGTGTGEDIGLLDPEPGIKDGKPLWSSTFLEAKKDLETLIQNKTKKKVVMRLFP